MSPFEAILGHEFKRPALLQEALTHRSAAPGTWRRPWPDHPIERGWNSSATGCSAWPWRSGWPNASRASRKANSARRLAYLVSQPVLATVAETIGLATCCPCRRARRRPGWRNAPRLLADALEAALGALYLDGGLDVARDFVRRAWNDAMIMQAEPPKDAKTALQEWAQKRGKDLPPYEVTARSGPPHAPEFTVTVTVGCRRWPAVPAAASARRSNSRPRRCCSGFHCRHDAAPPAATLRLRRHRRCARMPASRR